MTQSHIRIKEGNAIHTKKLISKTNALTVKSKKMKFDLKNEVDCLVQQYMKFLGVLKEINAGKMCKCERNLMTAVRLIGGKMGLKSGRFYTLSALPLYMGTEGEQEGGTKSNGVVLAESYASKEAEGLTTPQKSKNAVERLRELQEATAEFEAANESWYEYLSVYQAILVKIEVLHGGVKDLENQGYKDDDQEHMFAVEKLNEEQEKSKQAKRLLEIAGKRREVLNVKMEDLRARVPSQETVVHQETKSTGDNTAFSGDEDPKLNGTTEFEGGMGDDNAVIMTVVALKNSLVKYNSRPPSCPQLRKLHCRIVKMCEELKPKLELMESQAACPIVKNPILLNVAAGANNLSPVMQHANWLDGEDADEYKLDSNSFLVDNSESSTLQWEKMKKVGEFVINKVLFLHHDLFLSMLTDSDKVAYTKILDACSQDYYVALKEFNAKMSHPNSLKERQLTPISEFIRYDNENGNAKLKDHPWTHDGKLCDLITTLKNVKKAEDDAIGRMLVDRYGMTRKEAVVMHCKNMRKKTEGKEDIDKGVSSITRNREYTLVFLKELEVHVGGNESLLSSEPYLDLIKIRKYVMHDMFVDAQKRTVMKRLSILINASSMNEEDQGESKRLKSSMCIGVNHVARGIFSCEYTTLLRWNAIFTDETVTETLHTLETEEQRKALFKQMCVKVSSAPKKATNLVTINSMDGGWDSISGGQQYSKAITKLLCGPKGDRSSVTIPSKQIQTTGKPSVQNMNIVNILEKGLANDTSFVGLDSKGKMDMIVEILKYTNFQLLHTMRKNNGASSKSNKNKSPTRKRNSVNATSTALHFSPVTSNRNIYLKSTHEWQTWLQKTIVCHKCKEYGHYAEDCNKK
jgi:hypothetical protein